MARVNYEPVPMEIKKTLLECGIDWADGRYFWGGLLECGLDCVQDFTGVDREFLMRAYEICKQYLRK